jgi:2-keto-3-deoxy-L-rhamnonate aldolase RhmA
MKHGARSRLKAMIADGKVPLGGLMFSSDSSTSYIYGAAGYDFVIVDREHGMNDMQSTLAHIRAAEASGTVPLVRLLNGDPAQIQQTLDMGAAGVVIPKIGTAAQATSAVAASKYARGGRGKCPFVPATGFDNAQWSDHAHTSNEEVVVIPLIETLEGVENADAIAAVEGVDFLFFGYADLSQELGIDMYESGGVLQGYWERVVDAGHRHGVSVGTPLGFSFDELADFGTLTSDLAVLSTAVRTNLEAFRQRAPKRLS